jgi:type I restriction enzyme S subunit
VISWEHWGMRSHPPWRVEDLGTVLESIDAGWSPACVEQSPSTGQWGVLKVSAVTTGTFRGEEAKTLPVTLSPRPDIAVKRGDVVMARANGVAALVGMTAQVRDESERLMLSDKLLRLNPDSRFLTRDYLALLMLSSGVRLQLDRVLRGCEWFCRSSRVRKWIAGDRQASVRCDLHSEWTRSRWFATNGAS